MASQIKILDMTPVGRLADGSPIYKFSAGGFPSRGVRATGDAFDTPEDAYERGVEIVTDYEKADPYGNFGRCLGVTEREGKYRPVINTYHSNT